MKTIQELKLFIRDNLIDELKELENNRKIIKVKLIKAIILIIAINLIIISLMAMFDIVNIFIQFIFIQIALSSIIYYVIKKYISSEYVGNYKKNIINNLIYFINPALAYEHNRSISIDTFEESKIFLTHPTIYSGDDYVTGKIDETKIDFSELDCSYTSGSGKNKRNVKIFKGIFFVANFPKKFKSHTVILPDHAEKFFGFIGKTLQSWNTSRGQLIKLEDPEFEKSFVVYGDDQIESRYVLSTALMNRILDFKNKSKKEIYISFINNSIYIAISFEKDLFEPKIFGTLINFADIQEYFEILNLVIGIEEDLKLNLKIWNN